MALPTRCIVTIAQQQIMALEGDLSEFPLTDIIQLLDLSKKTGGVHINGRRGRDRFDGWLFFRDGKICSAKLGSLPPLEAAYTFFTLSSGPFRFYDTKIPPQTINRSNEAIIIEGIGRQETWAAVQEYVPSLHIVPQVVTTPAVSNGGINLLPEQWRVLTLVNSKNSVHDIIQRSGFDELRTAEIIVHLFRNGLIRKREVHLTDALFPQLESMATSAFGSEAQDMLQEAYISAGIRDLTQAVPEQILAALDTFAARATHIFGREQSAAPLAAMRAHAEQVFNSL